MNHTIQEVLEFVAENDVKFVRLAFCDIFGVQKNISIMPGELPSAFEHGISFDAHAIHGFTDVDDSDLLLFPDPSTLTVLPWRPGPGRVVRFYCDIRRPSQTPFSHDTRWILKQVIARCEQMGYVCKIGAECEFYLFKTDEEGEPTDIPLDKGGYLDISPLDRGENIRREICLTLEEMGILPETSHHEQGPGQNEIDVQFSDALSSADNFMTFKSVVKAIAARNGLFASFMPKPLQKLPGNGMHINLSLAKNGMNIFKNVSEGHSNIAESFIAGILEKASEISLFLNPIANSYERLGEFETPKYISWSHRNRSQFIRIPAAIGDKVRMELRSPDASLNPYLAFALLIAAGLEGIEKELPLPQAVDEDLYLADETVTKQLTPLPDCLEQAITLAKESSFVKEIIGEELALKIIQMKEKEAAQCSMAEDIEAFYKETYFYLI